jgi:hypothetical protein
MFQFSRFGTPPTRPNMEREASISASQPHGQSGVGKHGRDGLPISRLFSPLKLNDDFPRDSPILDLNDRRFRRGQIATRSRDAAASTEAFRDRRQTGAGDIRG